jgi:hypothetical protein
VTPADPELDDGADDEPSEPELDDEPELELPDPLDCAACPDEVPVLAFPVLALADPEVLLVLPCAAAGSSTMTTPATATPTIPAPMVAVRSRRRARSRATTADTVRSSLCMARAPLGGS